MADVFISYSKAERDLTVQLAAILENSAFSVWWDTELLPAQRFRAEIDAQLNACSAAVVIWSDKSSKSDWVLSEAEHAMRRGKLVNAHHIDMKPEDLPKPFGQIHAVPLTDTVRIIKAVQHIRNGKPPAPTVTSVGEAVAASFITESIEDALRWAPHLRELADREDWEDDVAYSTGLLRLAQKLEMPLRLFRERLPYPEITSYGGRRLVERHDVATRYAAQILSKEISWLQGHPDKKSVVSNARGDLSYAANRFLKEVELTAKQA